MNHKDQNLWHGSHPIKHTTLKQRRIDVDMSLFRTKCVCCVDTKIVRQGLKL